ncbi:MAG: hypothetical protein WC606_01075 [Candidatus Absconditabacterales bacterium]
MLELEKTYLLKEIPKGLSKYPHKDLLDIYIPFESDHAHVRIRKNGESMVIMKKELTNPNDLSSQQESVIHLTHKEFSALSQVPGKRIHKHRYYIPYKGITLEVDVFLEALSGLILVDAEFTDEETKNNFQMPEFCLCEVTQDVEFAGGLLCGKNYNDISKKLTSLGYKKLYIE